MPFALLAFLVMCVSNDSLLSNQIPRSFLELHLFNVFTIDFIVPLHIQFLGSYCHLNTFVDTKRQKALARLSF